MKFRLKDWAIFLGFEGLFLLGLSIGIWGSENFRPSPVAALVFFCGSLISLLIGATVAWTASHKQAREPQNRFSNPISLDDSFRAFLRFKQQPPIYADEGFKTLFLVVMGGNQRIQMEKGCTCILEHWSGPAVEVISTVGQQRLGARQMMKLINTDGSEVVLRHSTGENTTTQEAESRFLVHLISAGNSVK